MRQQGITSFISLDIDICLVFHEISIKITVERCL
jgi:hypothetical protein